MRKVRLFLAVFAVTLSGCSSSTGAIGNKELTQNEIKTTLSPSIVKVYCWDLQKKSILAQGSGFFIDTSGTFITNYHVLDDSYYVQIQCQNGVKKWVDKVNCFDTKTSDYAICSVKGLTSKAVTFANETKEKEKVYALGFPNNSSSLQQTEGAVVNPSVDTGKYKAIENTAKIDHGSSGGILANRFGKVLGITTGELNSGNYAAVPYSSFSGKLTNKANNKEPLETFHKVTKQSIGTYNLDTYFDYSITVSTNSAKYLSCYFYVQLKSKYLRNTILNGMTYLYVAYRVTVDYKVQYSGGSTSTFTASDVASFNIYQSNLYDSNRAYITLNYTGSATVLSRSNLVVKAFGGSGTLLIVN